MADPIPKLLAAVLFLSSALSVGMETFAYRLAVRPLEGVGFAENKRPRSCFIGPDDEVLDVSRALRKKKILEGGGWAAWNETRRLFIVHAPRFDQWSAVGLACMPQWRSIRVTFGLFSDSETWPDPPPGKAPDARFQVDTKCWWAIHESVVSGGSGQESWFFDASVDVGAEGVLSPDLTFRVSGECSPRKGERWGVDSGVIGKFGETFVLAGCRISEPKRSWLLTAKAERILPDGSPNPCSCLKETENGPVRVPWSEFDSVAAEKADDGRWVVPLRLLPGALGNLLDMRVEPEETDPDEPFPSPLPPPLPGMPRTKAPAVFSKWTTGPVIDLRSRIKGEFLDALGMGEDDMVVFVPGAYTLLLCCKDSETIRLFRLLLTACTPPVPRTVRSEIWLGAPGAAAPEKTMECFATGLTGQRTGAGWTFGDEEYRFLDFTVEPSTDCGSPVLDLLCSLYFVPRSGEFAFSRDSSISLLDGKEEVVGAFRTPDGKRFVRGMIASFVGADPEEPKE